jgi:tryptophanyl-tRNA synthetase
VKFDEVGKPGISNLLTIASTLTGKKIGDLEHEYAGKSYVQFKADVAGMVVGFLEPFQKRRAEFAADSGRIERILAESETKAKAIADRTLNDVRRVMGL